MHDDHLTSYYLVVRPVIQGIKTVAGINLQTLPRLRPYPMRGHQLLCHLTSFCLVVAGR